MSVLFDLYEFVAEDYEKFIGNGAYMALMFAAMYYIHKTEKDKRSFFVWLTLGIFIIFFNPVVILLIYRQFMWGTYWRILWLIPVVPVLAYVGTQLIMKNKKLSERFAVFAVLAAIIITGGRVMYNENNFQKRENFFKIPTAAIDISQHVLKYSGTWYPVIIAPNELYCYIRQYTSEIRLLYGRNVEGYMGGADSELEAVYREMSSTEPDCELIGRTAYANEVNIVIFNSEFHHLPDNDEMEAYGLYYGGPVGKYIFYVLKYD